MMHKVDGWAVITHLPPVSPIFSWRARTCRDAPHNAIVKIPTTCYRYYPGSAKVHKRKPGTVQEGYTFQSKSNTSFTSFLPWATSFPHNFKLLCIFPVLSIPLFPISRHSRMTYPRPTLSWKFVFLCWRWSSSKVTANPQMSHPHSHTLEIMWERQLYTSILKLSALRFKNI